MSGLIIVSREHMTASSIFDYPQLITFTTTLMGETLKKYSFQSDPALNVSIKHTFLDNCVILSPLIPTHFILSLVWLTILFVYYIYTFKSRRHAHNAFYL